MLSSTNVVVGRQGIYASDGLVGYELLFRQVGVIPDKRIPGDQMTAAVVFGAMSIGLDQLVGDRRIFVNADRGVFLGELPVLLPPEQTTIEIVETVDVDDDIAAGCTRLLAEGYSLALDDFRWGSGHERLLPMADIVKIDLMMTGRDELAGVIAKCQEYDVTMLAERVTSLDDVAMLTELGFELFQGYAFERPQVVPGRALTPATRSRLSATSGSLRLAEDFDGLETLLRNDPALTHQIIQLASVGRLGETRRSISTIRDALILAGTERVSNWLTLLVLATPRGSSTDAGALLATLQRARACELLASTQSVDASIAFTAGMVSSFDVLLGVSASDIADGLALSDELQDAAFGGSTRLAHIVQDAARYQLGATPHGQFTGLSDELLDAAFANAFNWAVEAAQALTEATGTIAA